MEKATALEMIDAHKNKLLHPVEMLQWTYLRLIVLSIPDEEWTKYVALADDIASR